MNASSIDRAYPNGTPVLLTLKFKNGEVLPRQSPLILMQYLGDSRLASFEPEMQDCRLKRTIRPNP